MSTPAQPDRGWASPAEREAFDATPGSARKPRSRPQPHWTWVNEMLCLPTKTARVRALRLWRRQNQSGASSPNAAGELQPPPNNPK